MCYVYMYYTPHIVGAPLTYDVLRTRGHIYVEYCVCVCVCIRAPRLVCRPNDLRCATRARAYVQIHTVYKLYTYDVHVRTYIYCVYYHSNISQSVNYYDS